MVEGKQKFVLARHEMVEHQLRARGVRDPRVLEAMESIPRELFVPAGHIEEAYNDSPLTIGFGQTISQPYIVGLMVQELAVGPGDRVLDVGAGSGYQAAILTMLARHVYAIERIEELSERAMETLASLGATNVTLTTGDGSMGWPEEAPFDRIISGAAAPAVPRAWLDQLKNAGRIVMPLGSQEGQALCVIERKGDKFTTREICPVRFVKLIGEQGWQEEG